MFTGIIQAIGSVRDIESRGADVQATVEGGELDFANVNLGDSIAVNGICLTVVKKQNHAFVADVSGETLSRTTFGEFRVGTPVNLEKALTLATPLGGHLVSGHVDGIGEVVKCYDEGRSRRFHIRVPDELARYIAEKGSICVDGTSLTVNKVDGAVFEVNIVPHTLEKTIMQHYKVGSRVNIEVDLIARYAERLLLGERAAHTSGGITEAFLAEHGFIK